MKITAPTLAAEVVYSTHEVVQGIATQYLLQKLQDFDQSQ